MSDNPVGQTSTTAQHTPGPWRVEDREPCLVIVPIWDTELDTDYFMGRHIATVRHGYIGGDMGYSGANARLIAAAPDLLDALRACIANFDYYGNGGVDQDTIDECRAAIAKAEGRQP